jgi:hypothetical protein
MPLHKKKTHQQGGLNPIESVEQSTSEKGVQSASGKLG